MKRFDKLFEKIVSFKNLHTASQKARLGKNRLDYVIKFEFNRETEIVKLREELLNNRYFPGIYKEFEIYEPKRRMISAAPYRDRIVHHALCNVIEPIFESYFIFDSYANRVGKGTHRAIKRFEKFSSLNKYVLKCDISKYFPSIDHEILKQIINEKIICIDTMNLVSLIVDNSNVQEPVNEYFPGDDLFTPFERRRGLPIGNLTSQFFANVYLNKLDQYIKNELRCKYYIRYVDDFVLFSNSKEELKLIKKQIMHYCEKIRLNLHPHKTMIYKTSNGVKFLGFRLFPGFRLLQRDNVLRAKRRFKKMEACLNTGTVQKDFVSNSLNGWRGHAVNANTYRLQKKMKQSFPLVFSNAGK